MTVSVEGSKKEPVEQQPEVKFVIEKIYTREISLEMPQAPAVFLERGTPKSKIDLKVDVSPMDGDFWQVDLHVMLDSSVNEQQLFILEVVQSGIFHAVGFSSGERQRLLHVDCAYILFPYIRETISSLLTKAGCPPMYLSPINFDALFEEQQKQA